MTGAVRNFPPLRTVQSRGDWGSQEEAVQSQGGCGSQEKAVNSDDGESVQGTREPTMARNPGRCVVLERGLWLAAAFCATLTANVWAQVVKPPRVAPAPLFRPVGETNPAAVDEDVAENVFLPADRHTLQKLADSRKLLAEGRYGEAVRYLGAILEGPEDFFFQPDKNSPIHRSLKAEAQRLIGQMPKEGRELYELQYGARARRMLDDALEAGDPAPLAEVSRRFFHTRSGYQATFLLGLHHFDHGRPLAGALTLQRLREAGPAAEEMEPSLSLTMAACWLQAGMSDKAREALVFLRQRQPNLRVAVAGREVPIFVNEADAIGWLVGLVGAYANAGPAEADRWQMFRGDAARNAATLGSTPLLNTRWRVSSTDDPTIEAILEQTQRAYIEGGNPAIPSLHPLAVDDVLLMRTSRDLLAVDFATGKRLWEVPEEASADATLGVPGADFQARQSMLATGIGLRMWADMTYGTLSSDGRCVFAIEDLDLVGGLGGAIALRGGGVLRRNAIVGQVTNIEQASLSNRLAAYEIRTGKLKWHLGGASGQYALRQPDTFFLGPPLPLMGQLYVLGEIKGEVRLMALDGATGDLLWSQQLAVVEQSVAQDPLRRLAGVSPSYADGILVCPTSTGAIVGVELATRSLLWGYRYGQVKPNRRVNMGIPVVSAGPASLRWIDASVCIADGRALATPVESESLYCLSLIDGELLWKAPRQSDLYVGCVDRDKVVLVGRRGVRALRMEDGKPAWDGRIVEFPENSAPSGRGFLSNDQYFVPLSTAEVVSIDLSEGKIAGVAKSRKGIVPGNLICYRGKVVSQSVDGVDAFYQLDAVRTESDQRLAANPDDAEALSLRGETLLDAGKRPEAVAAFRRAYELDADARTRELLRDSLLDGLRTEFAVYRDEGKDVERLLDDPMQRAMYLRLMADGLRQAGEWSPAFDYYEKLIDLEPDRLPLDQISKNLTVRRDRWFQGQLAMLRNEAKDDAPAKIDAAIAARLHTALAAGSIEPLQRFLNYFGNQPGVAPARTDLVRRLRNAGRLLDAELTGGELLRNGTSQEDADRLAKEQDASWPIGKVEFKPIATKGSAGNGFGRYVIETRGTSKPCFSDVSIHFDDSRHALSANDGWGRQQWQLSLAVEGQRQNFSYQRALTHARVKDHLLLVVLGWKILAIDTLGTGRNSAPRLLWSQDLTSSNADPDGLRPFPMGLINAPWQQLAPSYDRSGLLGPVTNHYVCFQRLRNLVAVDPRNGQALWTRQDVPPGSDLFGDDEYLFVLSPEREDAMLLRAADGEILGTRKVPRIPGRQTHPNGEEKTIFAHLEDSCLAALGRNLLLWWQDEDKRTLTLVDPLEERDLWPGRQFSNNARTSVVGEEAVGVMEPNGHFVLIGLPDGRTVADVQLEEEPALADISVLAIGSQYFLLTRSAPTETSNHRNIQPMPGCAFKPINRGRLYAFDKEGKLQWPEPTVIKDQHLLLDQPARLPIISFACNVYETKPNGEGVQKMSLLCIDKRNGRRAFKRDFAEHAGVLDIVGDAEKKTVDLVMQRETIRLTFTDQPLPPPSAADIEPAEPAATKSRAGSLWDSMKKVLGRMGQEPSQEDKKQ